MSKPMIYTPTEFVDDFEDLGLDRRISASKSRVANGEEGATTLVVLPSNLAEAFKPGGLTAFIESVRAKDAEFESDISSEPGRRALKSHCYKIARTKTGADDAGKKYVSDMKAQCKVVDAERKRMCDELDKINAERRKPLTDWEQVDEKRKAAHETALAQVLAFGELRRAGAKASDLEKMICGLAPYKERSWEEFTDRAKKVIGNTEHYLREAFSVAVKAEADAAELAILRKQAAERAQKERDERIAADAAEKARKEAEGLAMVMEARLAKQREEAERQIRDAHLREQQEAEKARVITEGRLLAAEAKAKKEAEDAERNRIAMEAQEKRHAEMQREMQIAAEKRAKDAAAKAAIEKKEAEKRAVDAERKRAEDERKRLAEIEAKRQADKQHRTNVREGVIEGICSAISDVHPMSPDERNEIANQILHWIDRSDIPNLTINY